MNSDRYVKQNFEEALRSRVTSMDWFEYLEIPGARETVIWGADDVVETPCETVLEYFKTDKRVAQLLRNHLGPAITQTLNYEALEEAQEEHHAHEDSIRRPARSGAASQSHEVRGN